MPSVSGEASGLRANVWNSAPETPSAIADQHADDDPGGAQLAGR